MDYNRDLYLKDFLEYLFGIFKNRSIEYLVLRNYTELPEHLRNGGDIDFILSESSFPRIYDVISSVKDLDILVSSKRTVVHEFIVRYKEKLFVKLDFHPFEDWHGAIYLKPKDLFSEAQSYKMFYVPSPFHQAITMLFASYLYGGFIKQKYMPFAKPILADDTSVNSLIPVVGTDNVNMIREFGKGNISDEQLLSNRRQVIFKLLRYNFKNEGLVFLKRFVATRLDEVLLRINYNGIVVRLRTKNNDKAINDLREFLCLFLGEDRVSVLNRHVTIKQALKTWDDVGRLKFVIYDNINPLFARKPDLFIDDEQHVCEKIVEFLINRQKK